MRRGNIKLSDHFTYRKLLRFTAPSIFMMIFTSIYGVVDGLFISNFVGKSAFASVNLIMPFIQVLSGMGAMIGVGGSALVSKTLGEGDTEKADRYFTMMFYLLIMIGIFFTVVGIAVLKPVSYLFGATDDMIADCVTYGTFVLAFSTMMHLQYSFQSFLVVAERPDLGLKVTVLAGLTNMGLDALFVAGFRWGVAGAAVATGMSQCVGGLIPLYWLMSPDNTSSLHFHRTKMEWAPILKASMNGAPEMLSSVSASITGILYNRQLMTYAGADGVAAYGVVMYAAMIFIAVFMGYSSGSSPIVSYHYGAQNHEEMHNLYKKGLTILAVFGLVLTGSAILLAPPIAKLFVGYDEGLMRMTIRALRICSIPFLIMGINMFSSSFFTALNDGVVSMEISFLRALVYPVISIIALPMWFQLDGVWYSMVASEALSFITAIFFLKTKQPKYGY